MRILCLILFCFGFAGTLSAQRISGKITSADGTSIEYVNVGVKHSSVGLVSDGKGSFSMTVPDSLRGAEMLFSHLSFQPLTIPVSDLLETMNSGKPVEIQLTERNFAMKEVTVFSGKGKFRQIGNLGGRLPAKGYVVPVRRLLHENGTEEWSGYRGEFGNVLKVRKRMHLHELQFTVKSCNASALARMTVYRLEEDGSGFTLLNQAPIYVQFDPVLKETDYGVDVSAENLFVDPGKVLVTMRFVDFQDEDLSLCVPVYAGEAYERFWESQEFRKSFIHMGFRLYGRILPD